ncbi:synaptotagmin-like protein 2 isoform X9 [Myxocyprinus asiaticus]|uniref:synaptotagmin-like protein 2 isoform X9 n=2 Tax=Myxocyprinus asiaticus TaxID=70543 RepID=UPI002223A6D8|nr:synaptotagmin-like protein 2 isoform X9 [Myxocyprinus asiaticus]
MIDLSYLTEEEQEMILAVLKRDTELKKLEEQRTRQLYKTEKDRSRLKYLTGEWFYETKYHRHREKIHGSDIIRASMRQRKPVTILELSQRWDERPSFLNSQKKDVFIPPELSGIIEEPSTQSQNERVEHQMPEGQQERQRPQIKPRLNPFNIVCSQRETSRISNSVNEANQTPAEEPLPSNESYTPLHSILNTDNTDTHIATQCADKPVPKKRLLLFSCQNSLLDFASSDTTVKQAMTPSPRGILKHSSSSCSYIESLRLHIPNNNDSNSSQSSAPVSPISPPLSPCSEHSASSWLDRKQVRFSSIIRAKEREQGENSVLDEDCSALSDQDRELDRSDIVKNDRHELYAEPQSSQVSNFHCSAAVKGKVNPLCTESQTHTVTEEEGRSISKVLEWFVRGSQDAKQRKLKELPAQSKKNKEEPEDHGTSDDKSEELASPVIQQKTKPSPKPRQVFFALFTRAEKKDKSPEVLVSDKEVIIEDKTGISTSECKTLCTMRPQADDSIALQDSVPALSKTTEIIQVTSKTEDDNKTARHVCADILKREMLDQGEISPGRLADLKSFWERGNRGPRILSIKTGAGIEENETYLLNENDHDTLDRRLPDSNISPSKFKPILKTTEYPIDGESTTHEFSLVSRYGVDMSAISLNKDVKPSNLDSSKESEGLSSGLHTLMVKSDVRLMSSSLQLRDNSLQNKGQEEPLPESLLRNISDLKKEISTLKMSPSQQDNKVSINDLKSFWEKEKSGLRVIVGSPTCTPDVEDPFTTLSPKRSSIGSTSPVLTSCLDKMSLSLNKEVSLIVQKEKMEKSQGPTKEPIQDHQGIRGRITNIAQNTSNCKPQLISDKHLKPSPPSSSLRSLPEKGQHDTKQSTNIYQPKDQDQTRTPSPLRQPKIPPKDSYPNKESRKEDSPLRTFVIDISPPGRSPYNDKVKTHEEMPSYSLNIVTEKMGNINCSEGYHMPLSQDSSKQCVIPKDGSTFYSKTGHSQVSASELNYTSPEHLGKTLDGDIDIRPIMPKERKFSAESLTNSRLARSYIPLSLHHYLSVPEQAVLDERERLGQVEVQIGEVFEQGNQGSVSNQSSPSRRSQSESEEITFDSSGSSTLEAWSFSRTSSACDSEEASPVRTALEHANARPLSISKSLEDLASPPSLSAVTTNTKTSFSDPEQVKIMSMSVPAFMQQEMDWRNGERSFHYDTLRACNTPSNFSMCSEVASMSSVTGSILSICSSEFGSVEVKGTIQFTIHYSQKLGEFHIFIVQCKDLAVADPKRKRSDPYVKCYLLPDKAKYGKRKTCVRKKTQNPTYNEILRFKIPMESLKTQKLNLSVWHNDTFGRNSFLGEAEIDLVEWDFNNMQMNEYQLKGRVQVPSSPKHSAGGEEMRAEMRIALRFLPQTSHSHKNKANGEVQIWVKECKNLPISRGVSIDPFVKCAVLPDNSRKSQQKTRVLKRASNPVFNHTMVYDGFRPEDLKEACVELTVWDHDRFNHFIGGVRLGPGTGKSYGADVDWMDSNSAEAALWDRMMQSQNEWVEDILPLRMLVMARMSR